MFEIISESIRLGVFFGISVYLWLLTGKRGVRREWGWPHIFAALLLINLGLAISLTEDFPSLGRYVVLGDSPYEPLIKNLVVFLAGFTLLVVGIVKMITPTLALKETQAELQEAYEELEQRVEERTAELERTNEYLQSEISERRAVEAALRKARDDLEDRVEERTVELKKSNEELLAEVSRRTEIEKELRESEERYRLLAENPLIGVYLHQDTFLVYVNRRAEEVLGYAADELASMRFWEVFRSDEQEQIKERGLARYRGHQEPAKYETRIVTGEGETRWIELSAVTTRHRGKPAVIGTLIDITDRKRAEEALRESEERYRTLVELLPIGVGIHSQGRIVLANRAAAKLMSAESPDDLLGKPVTDLLAPENHVLSTERIMTMMQEWKPAPVEEMKFVQVDGTLKDAEVHATPIMHNGKPAVLVAALDISDRKGAEEQIKASLKEKEVMLREIHHRVKNNLAMIISLLSLQSQYTTDETVNRMFQDAQARIRSMVLAHEVLFRSENLADIQIGEYVGSLADYLLVAIGNVGVSIDLKKEFEDISFSLDTAVPLGLIVSEIVSNSLKHAFPEAQEGEIGISLRSLGDKEFELVVRDNGVGMPQAVDLQDSGSFGLKLVQTFVRQLHGEIEIRGDNGTEVRVRFKEIRKRDWREKISNNDADMLSKS